MPNITFKKIIPVSLALLVIIAIYNVTVATTREALIHKTIEVQYNDFKTLVDLGFVDTISYAVDDTKAKFTLKKQAIELIKQYPQQYMSALHTAAENLNATQPIIDMSPQILTNQPTFQSQPDTTDTTDSTTTGEILPEGIPTLSNIEDPDLIRDIIEYSDRDLTFKLQLPLKEGFLRQLLIKGVKADIQKQQTGSNVIVSSLLSTLVYLVVMGFFIFLIGKNMGLDKFSIDEKDLLSDNQDQNFDKIGGHWETKKELQDIIELINNRDIDPEKAEFIPKGYLLVGPPGTGKTALARAIANATQCKFLYACASDFVRLYVGQGSANVRKLMDVARKNAPCIVFLDEIDALGRRGMMNGNSENDSTINTLLTEIDGFKDNRDIIFIGATNYAENVDPALTRAGRLERKIQVNLPELGERVEILNIYLSGVEVDESVDVERIAEQTAGFSGADLENLVKTAVLETIINKTEKVTQNDIDESFFKIVMQGNKRSRIDPEMKAKRKIVAYHESGHTLAHWLFQNNIPTKVTIIPSTSGAGGVTISTPSEVLLRSKRYLKSQIKVLYGGRIAEEYLLKDEDEITVGAQQDIIQATDILENIVNYYGMNGKLINYEKLKTDNTSNIKQMEELAEELYREAKEEIFKNGDLLDKLSEELLKHETLSKSDLEVIFGIKPESTNIADPEQPQEQKQEQSEQPTTESASSTTEPASTTTEQPTSTTEQPASATEPTSESKRRTHHRRKPKN